MARTADAVWWGPIAQRAEILQLIHEIVRRGLETLDRRRIEELCVLHRAPNKLPELSTEFPMHATAFELHAKLFILEICLGLSYFVPASNGVKHSRLRARKIRIKHLKSQGLQLLGSSFISFRLRS